MEQRLKEQYDEILSNYAKTKEGKKRLEIESCNTRVDSPYSAPPTTWTPEMWEGARRFADFLYDLGDEDIYGYFDAFAGAEEKKEGQK
jgi:hypothetical protein